MENGKKNNNNEKESAETDVITNEPSNSLFTKEGIRDTVRSFVLAWIKGDVVIDFPSVQEIVERASVTKTKVDFNTAREQEIATKRTFVELVSIICRQKPATAQQKEKAISDMFIVLIKSRCGERIKGTFGKQDDHEARLDRLEEEIVAMNATIEELIIAVRSLQNARRMP